MWAMFKYGIGISDCGVLRYTQRTWTERQGVVRAERGNLVFHIVVSCDTCYACEPDNKLCGWY